MALQAARQGAPHGFRYADRLLDVDLHLGYSIQGRYRVVCISGLPPSNGRRVLL